MQGIDVLRTLVKNEHFPLAQKLAMFMKGWKTGASDIIVEWIEELPHEQKLEAISAMKELAETGGK